jgi:hypothetical protein
MATFWRHFGDFRDPRHVGNWQLCQILLIANPPTWGKGGVAQVAILLPPPFMVNSCFLPLSPSLNDICPFFLLLFVPLDAPFFYVSAILGWLLLAVQF